MIEDSKIIEAVERYIDGQMNPEERVQFENLRKTSPEVDQLVVEHTFFMQQLDRFCQTKKLRLRLADVHTDLASKGFIAPPNTGAKLIHLFNRYKRTAAIAASIAGITALGISVLVSSIAPVKPVAQIEKLSRDINALKIENKQQNQEIERAKQVQKSIPAAPITYKTGGTGFLVDAKGYLVTNAHVIQDAKNIVVQNNRGKDLAVAIAYIDTDRDIAILKITDTAFKAAPLPYSIKRTSAEIAEPLFTLGFPRNDMVYGEGYLAAKTGFNGDTLTCQIAIAANPGNSGGPILNHNGEVIGILSTRQTSAEGVVFATQSRYIFSALKELQKDSAYKAIKMPATSNLKNLDRVQQVKKIADYVYLVKVR
ncbi:MAG TPA: serine protease [Chitinophagaceae bacterium]|nr:serine protease [Chitinophagaceae bacterium]